MATRKKPNDVLRSSQIVRAEQVLRDDPDVPPIVRDAHQMLRAEIVSERMQREIDRAKPAPPDNYTHPAVTGVSVGGIKELCDYLLQLATEHDPVGRDLLNMSVVDGMIVAVISAGAAWITQPQKKRKD